MYYRLKFKHKLNLEEPQTFNEKLQWLKLNNKNPLYSKLVDKYEVRECIKNKIGEEFLIPMIGIYDRFEDIDFEKLPNRFVLKCTHDSGSVIICKDKEKFDEKSAKRELTKALKRNFYYDAREWPYKNVKPRIIVEEYMEDSRGELTDYKFYSFDGKCDYVMTCVDRMNDKVKFIYYDKNWKLQKDLSYDGLKYGDSIKVERPKNLDKMFELASKLSEDIPFVRVDFYEVSGKLYFGELTFYPTGGFDNKRTIKMQEYLDNSLNLKINKGEEV